MAKPFIDVVKWDGLPGVYAWKHPEQNLSTLTQLIVNESQEAVLFHGGKLLAKFGPGRHTLSTENIPLLRELYGIPFGGKNPFTAEMWFTNRVHVLNVKWGTGQPFQIRDPQYKIMIPVRAHGQFGIRIENSEDFLVKLVGTQSSFTGDAMTDYFKGLLITKGTAIIAKKIAEEKMSLLDVAQHIDALSDRMKEELSEEFAKYGISVVSFYVNHISTPESDPAVVKLKEMLAKKAEMDLLGYQYHESRSFDVLESASRNEGGMAGNLMGMGVGLGAGMGAGGAMGNMYRNAGFSTDHGSPCPKCGKLNHAGARFCSSCGHDMEATPKNIGEDGTKCNKCGSKLSPDAKFCPKCGDRYNPCPECRADVAEGETECPNCGKTMNVTCTGCNSSVPGDVKFCPRCGKRMQEQCAGCASDIKPGFAFCSECGLPVDPDNKK